MLQIWQKTRHTFLLPAFAYISADYERYFGLTSTFSGQQQIFAVNIAVAVNTFGDKWQWRQMSLLY